MLDKIRVTCPHCGHEQLEPAAAISTLCRRCHGHFELKEALRPAPPEARPGPERRHVHCFDCGTELEVARAAESTMCKRCGRYVDLHDYRISSAVCKNFRTKGSFTVEPKGYVFNTEALVSDAVIKGRFHGKLNAEHSLTIFSSAEIKGTFTTGQLVIPADNVFHWKLPISVGGAEIAGELIADLKSHGTVHVKSTARMFGDIEAVNAVVEPGAVIVGRLKIGGNDNS
jgi:cytoskeletal protein CcmA (bactofilin family)/DNA-directed RNA polymerase subunit RPC12/RpoP